MRAMILAKPAPAESRPLQSVDLPVPEAEGDFALIRVLACGVCRTDLHIVEGELPVRLSPVVPGHQIVGEVVSCPNGAYAPGTRVGVSWIGGTDGTCKFCRSGRENLCDDPLYTGYTHNGGYAQYTTARTEFLHSLPAGLDVVHAAPLLCAGVIGFRSLRVAEVKPGQKVGLLGFGSCAQLMIQVLRAWNCEVYVATREENRQKLARTLGAVWSGGAYDVAPARLDAAITFAPSGSVVLAALRSLDKGGILAINAIHLDRMPEFDYDSVLWGERQIRSVTNMTRDDAREFLSVAAQLQLTPDVQTFPLEEANEALLAQKQDQLRRTAVLLPPASA
jgi:alcohol dehydrogenase, propanol-preferring